MISPQNDDPFFPPDWREQVRDFLAPLKENGLPYGHEYRMVVISQESRETIDSLEFMEATFRLGDVLLEMIGLYWYGMEEKTTVIHARKADFSSALHFWCYAMLIYLPLGDFDRPTAHSSLDFSQEQRSHILSAQEFLSTIKRQWPNEEHALHGTYPLPRVIEEPIVWAWQSNDKWNEWFEWAETSDSFVLWCWRTYA
ncbi:hypothetical protein EON83_29440 [bacterium]|nr:MAG: hypothetical protein EON83_29440 [bacterium]